MSCFYFQLSWLPLVRDWAVCQRLSIADQLNGGVRMLDLRVTQDDDQVVWLHHNLIWCCTLPDLLDSVKEFVTRFDIIISTVKQIALI